MRRLAGMALGLVLLGALGAGPASPADDERTMIVSAAAGGRAANGVSARPSLSARGDLIVFDSTASNLAPDPNGAQRDVFLRVVGTSGTGLISDSASPGGADGPSRDPVIAANGGAVAFESDAANLIATDNNGVTDVFLRTTRGPIERVSVATGGGEADGPSADPDVSADGRRVAFVSFATNLVEGDTNNQPDIFVRDRATGNTILVSARGKTQGDGASGAPAISPDGRYVSFASRATNLDRDDANTVMDVFLADLRTGTLRRVSVNSRREEQNRAVIAPFFQVSDVSLNGRYVAFDSDATNLVPRDRNRDTDVFVHDTRKRLTSRVSVEATGREGNNDSFYPSISRDGRYVAFESFASNFSRDDAPKEDVFVFDRRAAAPALVGVSTTGDPRGPELVKQLLQRPAISADGKLAAFSSTAGNLTPGDDNRQQDVFVRELSAPRAEIALPSADEPGPRPRYSLVSDDPDARRFVCSLDGRRFECDRRGRLPRLSRGRHTLRVLAGGPGMLYSWPPAKRTFVVR